MNDIAPIFVRPDVTTGREFTRHLNDLLRNEQGAMVKLLFAIGECDGRRIWAEMGYTSLFEYLHRELKLSRSAAYFRAAAAGLVLKHPEVADALADGRLCLSTVGELGKVITSDNVQEVLPRFFHLSAREAREVVAEIAPRPAPPRHLLVSKPVRIPAWIDRQRESVLAPKPTSPRPAVPAR